MREQKVLPREFEFYFPDLDNMVLVQSPENGLVTIRSTRNNFSEKEKLFFIRGLAAEGFIPDNYEWYSGDANSSCRVRFVKDCSWLSFHPVVKKRANRFMRRMLVGSVILWIAMMRVVLVSAPHLAANPHPIPQRTVAGSGSDLPKSVSRLFAP